MDRNSHRKLARKAVKSIAGNLLYLVPSEIRYEICRHHANKEFAENRSDFRTNGELWLMKRILPCAKTVFDVGAHIGDWASRVLQLNPSVDLHCFEPSQRPLAALQGRKFRANVTCNPFGLGADNCHRALYVSEELSEGSSLYLRRGLEIEGGFKPQQVTEQVEIRTLDSYCQEKRIAEVDFLKIDVEGHELEVIKGGKGTLERERVKIVQFEYGGTYIDSRILLRDLFDFFGAMNYSFFLLYPKQVRLIPQYDQRLENFQYKNFLIVNNGVVKEIDIFQGEHTHRQEDVK